MWKQVHSWHFDAGKQRGWCLYASLYYMNSEHICLSGDHAVFVVIKCIVCFSFWKWDFGANTSDLGPINLSIRLCALWCWFVVKMLARARLTTHVHGVFVCATCTGCERARVDWKVEKSKQDNALCATKLTHRHTDTLDTKLLKESSGELITLAIHLARIPSKMGLHQVLHASCW